MCWRASSRRPRRIAGADGGISAKVVVPHAGSDPDTPALPALDAVQGRASHVHEEIRDPHPQLHVIDEVGPGGEERGAGPPGHAGDRARDVRGALVREGSHDDVARIAAAMLTYAPHRQRLPLIRSRISSPVSSIGGARSRVT